MLCTIPHIYEYSVPISLHITIMYIWILCTNMERNFISSHPINTQYTYVIMAQSTALDIHIYIDISISLLAVDTFYKIIHTVYTDHWTEPQQY